MGRGNFYPAGCSENNVRMVYITLGDEGCVLEELIDDIMDNLPPSFHDAQKDSYRAGRDEGLNISENGLFEVAIAENEDRLALFIVVKDDAPAFAASRIQVLADRLFDSLADGWELSVRCGSWLSGKYVKSSERIILQK